MVMAKNQVQFQKGLSLPDFLEQYGSEARCREALFQWRWPSGFRCPEVGHTGCCQIAARQLFQCHRCHHQTSVTAGTIFEGSKLALRTWFLGMYLLTQSKNGVSALELKCQLGISYNAAWRLKHKLMQAMKEQDDRRPLAGAVQLDDAYWGGERRGGKRGRGAPNKAPFLAAVATDVDGHPIAIRLSALNGFRSAEIRRWADNHLAGGHLVVSDGLSCCRTLAAAGHAHSPLITGSGPASVEEPTLVWVNTMIGNVKNSLHGTYHAIARKHLPRYLGEFCYRFNRRFDLPAMLARLGRAAVRTPPMPERLLKMAEAQW
jgi:transposase-like protein